MCRDFSSWECVNNAKEITRNRSKQWPLERFGGLCVVPEDLIGHKDVTCRKCRGQVDITSKAPEINQFKVSILIAYDQPLTAPAGVRR